ncbi:YtxH domain-containing protein [Psychrobacillus sp. INOP01]|uniref:YtxH domain-containing protein n=1 Tax=Psychrobacillus sp. INOP01 TaxID=2829187 RepID=UPI001BA88958|nr:YtxH domain-containing protein [Psychrobacillus sp. INOP01]QUG42735.1 YtxH domain-containing protein [Psychrobacillus sp. INOP01]
MKLAPLFCGLATGLLVGASTVLMTTPKSGMEVRSSFKASSNDFRDKLSDIKLQLANVKNSINNLTNSSKEVVPGTIEDLKSSIAHWKNETAPIQAHLQAEISSIQEAMAELEKKLPKKQEATV